MALTYTTKAYFEPVTHRYIKKIDLFTLAWEQGKPNKLCSRYSRWDLSKSFLIIWDENRKPKEVFQLFVNRNSRHSRWEIYGNGNSRSCMPLEDLRLLAFSRVLGSVYCAYLGS